MSAVRAEYYSFSMVADGQPISFEFDKHFYLASIDPALSLTNNGVGFPDPRYTFYQAHRLEQDTVVEGLNVIGINDHNDLSHIRDDLKCAYAHVCNVRGHLKHIHQNVMKLPAGSLILHESGKSFDDPGAWCGVTPYEARLSNLQRVAFRMENGRAVCADRWGRGSGGAATTTLANQRWAIGDMSDADQAEAHRKDILKMSELGILPEPLF